MLRSGEIYVSSYLRRNISFKMSSASNRAFSLVHGGGGGGPSPAKKKTAKKPAGNIAFFSEK